MPDASILNSITGNIETARLIIKDCRLLKASQPSNALVLKGSQQVLSRGVNSLVTDTLSDTNKIFKVQFNPNKLAVYATSLNLDKMDTRRDEKGQRKIYADSAVKPTVELSVDLIFDHVNNYDAFMWDKMNQGAGEMMAKAVTASVKGPQVYTVQTEVEGLISALRDPYTRSITFSWADFSFSGQLRSVMSRYTMFSVSGRPIRAQVMLRIRQKQDQQSLQNWYKDFDSAFGVGNASSLTTGPQGFSNLLNLGL